jgi:hypothetical protein
MYIQMSGSFYSLNTQYNTLLAILEDINQDKLAQDLENVLIQGDDAAGLNMTNVGAITVGTLNYTTLNPAVPEVIGNLSQVLAVGNDATNQSITNMGSVALKAGGGGSITYADGTVQSTAYTGSAGGDQTIQQVLAEGSDAGGQQISNILGLSTGSVATNPNNALTLLSLNTNNINLTAFPTASASSGQVVIQTQELGGIQNNWYFTNNGDFDLPQGCSINYPSGSGLGEQVGQIDLSAVGADLNLNATGVGGINLNSATTTLSGTLTFPDTSIQTTAYTGSGGTETLSAVLTAGNSAEGQQITNVSAITTGTYASNPNQGLSLQTNNGANLNLECFTPGIGDSGSVAITTTPLVGSTNTWYFTPNGDFDLPNSGTINFPSGAGLSEQGGGIDLTVSGAPLNLNAAGVGESINLYASNTSLSGTLTFPDLSVQTTAFTGSATTPNLSAVLTAGNNASGIAVIDAQSFVTELNTNAQTTISPSQSLIDYDDTAGGTASITSRVNSEIDIQTVWDTVDGGINYSTTISPIQYQVTILPTPS